MGKRKKPNGRHVIQSFKFQPDEILADKYKVVTLLGSGWEGEVYLIRERGTGIERTAKFFFPHRNPRNLTSKSHAKKLHKLRDCPMVIQYHTQEKIRYEDVPVTFLVSEFVEGELLNDFLKRQPGRRLSPFQALHLLHSLADGIASIHEMGEYHGDLHTENIIVQRYGLGFELKFLDVFNWGRSSTATIQDDVVELIRIFHEALGGRKHYAGQRAEVKSVCCGLKRSLILRKFRTAGQLRAYLETMEWD